MDVNELSHLKRFPTALGKIYFLKASLSLSSAEIVKFFSSPVPQPWTLHPEATQNSLGIDIECTELI